MNTPFTLTTLIAVSALAVTSTAAEIYLGSGVKVGEVTDTTAIVHLRLTSTSGQNERGLIAGTEGEARIHVSAVSRDVEEHITPWQAVDPDRDWSCKFQVQDLAPGARHVLKVEYRANANTASMFSDPIELRFAPKSDQRTPVTFHLTTCQDTRGADTYTHMLAQRPDFCVSAGDTVYYDGEGDARTVAEAFQAYQKMYGLPQMKEYHEKVPTYFMKDDHDYRFNDADPHMPGRWVGMRQNDPRARYTETRGNQKLDIAWLTHEEGVQTFKDVFPLSDKTYRTTRWGKGLEVWMLENRDYRSPNQMPDGPEKTIWGAQQKAWLKETLLASDAEFKIIVSPNPIIGPDRIMKGDNQANLNGFWFEGQAFLDWLKEHKLSNVILMCGDRHWQYHSIDNRNGRGVHEFSCGPTCDEHVQEVPPPYEGVDRPYSASRGGFLKVSYDPQSGLTCEHHSATGKPLHQHTFPIP